MSVPVWPIEITAPDVSGISDRKLEGTAPFSSTCIIWFGLLYNRLHDYHKNYSV